MKKIWINGANGQLGRALNQLLNPEECEIVNTDIQELDIAVLNDVLAFTKEQHPDLIVNCAAFTNVNLCETEVDAAYRANAIGPRNLSIASAQYGIPLMHVSTDYVFDGSQDRPYTEYDEPCPQSVYGASKLAGERYVQQFTNQYFIIRTAWLYGDGNNFVKTMLRLSESNDSVRVVNDQFGTPTSAKELARMMIHLMHTQEYGIYHGTCEGSCSWYDFAVEIFRRADQDTKVIPISTEAYPTPAKRPANSVLDNCVLRLTSDYRMSSWQEAFAEYMQEI